MGTVYGANYTKALAGDPSDRLGAEYGGRVKAIHETYSFASAGVGTILVVGVLKPGEVFLMGYIHGGDLGSATTLEMGISGDTDKFLAATTFTTTDQKTLCLDDDGVGYKNDTSVDVPIIITTGVEEATGDIEVLILKASR
jgi:hypothetical protein